MNGPEHVEFMNRMGIQTTAERVIDKAVDKLLDALYVPYATGEHLIYKRDPERCEHFGISEDEPINWGDLKCCEVKPFADGKYRVTIDEASPGECPTLCEYIRKYLKLQGWDCEVQTEW